MLKNTHQASISILFTLPLLIAVTHAICSSNCADCGSDEALCESSAAGCVFTGVTNHQCMTTSDYFLGPVSNRADAADYCNSKGSQLAIFHSYEAFNDGREICASIDWSIAPIGDYVTGIAYDGCWIGLTRDDDGSNCDVGGNGPCGTPFHWDDDSSLDYGFDSSGDGRYPHDNVAGVGGEPWHPTNPNYYGGVCFGYNPCREVCVHLLERFTPPDNFRWNDIDCRYENYALCNPIPCNDVIGCTIDILNPATGECVYIPSTEICTDGGECSKSYCDATATAGTDGCVYVDTNALCLEVDDIATNKCKCPNCVEGVCSTEEIDCTDNNPCTTDICDSTRGCVNYFLEEDQECNDNCQCLNELICKNVEGSKTCQQPESDSSENGSGSQ